MWKILAAAVLCTAAFTARAQSCEGGLYLNPQIIRGEAVSHSDGATKELIDFLKPTGLQVSPVINIRETRDVTTALKRPLPPCWIYGNPVVGLASGYAPAAVNLEEIRSAVLILGDGGGEKNSKPVALDKLPRDKQAAVLARLKTISCFGMKSGVTTSLVQAERLCGTVVEVMPQQGLGQSYLPTKAAFDWRPDRWVGLITRVQSAEKVDMKSHVGADERIHTAQLIVVPTVHASWGYGLYVKPDLPAEAVRRAAAQFAALKSAPPSLQRALDVGPRFEFTVPGDADVKAMRELLASPQ